ncbi:threonine synthase [candidate division KSB1 bacterium]|nr:threonine synthase [candidate division KSB1 bacterium]
MKLYSTRNKNQFISFEQAVLKGLADDGGLFMPATIPQMDSKFYTEMKNKSFQEIGFEVEKKLLMDDIPEHILQNIVENAFNFDIPLVKIEDNVYVLELFHGPTLAFKDFAARFMSRLMSYFIRGADKKLTILVATSGDTGSAVANGFYGIPGIEVIILYPSRKISTLQEKQMATLDKNITALEIDGTFDDCQRLVKQAFVDSDLREKLWLTSANSINIARLIPQSFYYFYAFSRVANNQKNVVFSVPCGNFGNITGGMLAKRMGLPITKFIAATNANDIVPQYLQTGAYLPQPAKKTISNAMDVGDPSNWDRIMDLYGKSLEKLKQDVFPASFSDEKTKDTIRQIFSGKSYVFDPHGAVGYLGLKKYFEKVKEKVVGVTLATAHPAKFGDIVENEINEKIELPPQLSACLDKEKKSIMLPGDFEAFKDFLMSQSG